MRDRADDVSGRSGLRERINDRRLAAEQRAPILSSPAASVEAQATRDAARRAGLLERMRERAHAPRLADPKEPRVGRDPVRDHRSDVRPRYYDRPDLVRHTPHHVHTYYDHRYDRLHHRIIWPRYHYPVCYTFGPRIIFRTVFPYYHRKYVFISLGGWWPSDYHYVRYYWYGWHPYTWYGYYPVAREVPTETYQYYTYNYYLNGDGDYPSSYPSTGNEIQAVDESTWADVRARLEQQQAEPAPQGLADTRFEEGVKSFEAGDYSAAAEKFAAAMNLAPNDMILPFAYAQALFAEGQHTRAAEVLRVALRKVSPEQEGVFYPRGLYANDDVLFGQVQKLMDKMEDYEYDADLQLLLGYHLLGIGETEYARGPLERASQDQQNAEAARTLLKLVEKIEAEAATQTQSSGASAVDGNAAGAAVESAPAPRTEGAGAAGVSSAPAAPAATAPEARAEDSADVVKDGAAVHVVPEAGAGENTPPAKREDDDVNPTIQRSGIDPNAR